MTPVILKPPDDRDFRIPQEIDAVKRKEKIQNALFLLFKLIPFLAFVLGAIYLTVYI